MPGWVEASFIDANEHRWSFFDKPPIFSAQIINRSSSLPMAGVIRCEVPASRSDDRDEEILEIQLLDGVESEDGTVRFSVRADQVVTE